MDEQGRKKNDRRRLRRSFLTLWLTFGLSRVSVTSARKRKRRKEREEKNLVISCLVFFTLAHLQGNLFISEEGSEWR